MTMTGDKQMPDSIACMMRPPLHADVVQERFTDAFRKHVGRGKAYSIPELSDLTGIDHRTLDNYASGRACPNLTKLLTLSDALGPVFASDIFGLVGMGVGRLKGGHSNIHAAAAEAASFLSHHTKRMEDGRIDHRERRETIEELRRLIGKLQDVVAGEVAP